MTKKNEYQDLLDRLQQTKAEMNMFYDFYKDRRAEYESIKSQLEAIIVERQK